MFEWIRERIREAGAPTEADTERDGFLSNSEETHALGLGLGAGWFFAVTGDERFLGLLYAAIVTGLSQGRDAKNRRSKVLVDVVKQPHYAAGGVVAGVVLGFGTNWLLSSGIVPRP